MAHYYADTARNDRPTSQQLSVQERHNRVLGIRDVMPSSALVGIRLDRVPGIVRYHSDRPRIAPPARSGCRPHPGRSTTPLRSRASTPVEPATSSSTSPMCWTMQQITTFTTTVPAARRLMLDVVDTSGGAGGNARALQQGDPASHRRRGHLPEPGRDHPAGRRGPGRADR